MAGVRFQASVPGERGQEFISPFFVLFARRMSYFNQTIANIVETFNMVVPRKM